MNWQELTDRKLVELCLQGNEDAWREFLRRYNRLLAGVVAKTIHRSPLMTHKTVSIPSLIQDGVQDVWARICANNFRALRELEWRHDGALRGLLQIAASNVAKDIIRKHMSEKWNSGQEDSLEDPDLVIPVKKRNKEPHGILLEQLVGYLQKVTRGEPDSYRDIEMFRLFYGSRVTASDLAEQYQLNVRKVENILARLLRLARKFCL